METKFYERIRLLCDERDITLKKFQDDCKIHASTMKGWGAGQKPTADRVVLVAQYFNVSTDYILGVTDDPSTLQDVLDDDDIASLQRARAKMSQRDRERMMEILKIGFDYAFEEEDTPKLRTGKNKQNHQRPKRTD